MDERFADRWVLAWRGESQAEPGAAFDDGDDIDIDALLADADSMAATLNEPEAARFNTNHGAPGSGHGGQFVAAGGGGGGTKPKAGKAPAGTPQHGPVSTGGSHAAQKRELHARAQADREQARKLEKQLHALHAQMKASVAAHHKATAAAKAAKAGHPVHHHRKAAKHHHKHARSLHARIAALRTKIRGLLTQARELDAKAAKL